MTLFTLAAPGAINGEQLADEIRKATGLDVSETYAHLGGDVVRIPGVDGREAEVQAIVGAHVPNPLYFQADRDDATARNRVVQLAQSAVGVALTDLTAAQVRALLAVRLWKDGAISPDGKIRPLAEWAKR